MGSSTPLETFERLWRIANEIAAIRETEVKIAAFTDLSCRRAGLLPEMLTRHGLELRRQLAEKLQKLEKEWGKQVDSFINMMLSYDFNNCYVLASVVQEMKAVRNELESTKGKLTVISMISSYLRAKQNESWYSNSIITQRLLGLYRAIEARLLKRKEILDSLFDRLRKLCEYWIICNPGCIEYIERISWS